MKATLILAGALVALIAVHTVWNRPPQHVEARREALTGSLEVKCADGSQPVAQTNDNVYDYDALIVTCGEVRP